MFFEEGVRRSGFNLGWTHCLMRSLDFIEVIYGKSTELGLMSKYNVNTSLYLTSISQTYNIRTTPYIISNSHIT